MLTEQVQGLQKRVFGDSSEKRSLDKPPKESTTPRSSGGRTPKDRLPHVDTHVELAEEDRICPSCEGPLQEMKGRSDDCEVIDIVQRKFLVRRIRRQKYRCKCQQAIVVAPPSLMHIPHGRYTLDVGAEARARPSGPARGAVAGNLTNDVSHVVVGVGADEHAVEHDREQNAEALYPPGERHLSPELGLC